MVKVWKGNDGWCVAIEGKEVVFVFQTLRSAMRRAEAMLKALYPKEVENE